MNTVLYPNCTQCCGGGVPTNGPCCGCPAVPLQYSLPVSGFTSDTTDCDANCTDLNGTWTLTLDEPSCTYSSGDGGTCNTGEPTWSMFCDATNWYITTASTAGSTVNRWVRSRASWNCLGPNTLTLDTLNFCSGGVPGTLTVTPV